MSWRHEVDVVTTFRLQLQHHLRKSLVRYFILELLLVRLRNLIVLTINAAQVAVAKEDVSCPVSPDERRFFTKVCGVRRNDRESARVARSDLVLNPIVEAVARTDRALLKELLERVNSFW